jgi:N-acetyl-gamma-glutamylphosphate reductase
VGKKRVNIMDTSTDLKIKKLENSLIFYKMKKNIEEEKNNTVYKNERKEENENS